MFINTKAFFELVRAGLWENEVRLSNYKNIDFAEVYRLAEEQSVIGMVAAGIDHVVDVKVPQVWALQFAGQTIQLEQRNKAMNQFIADLIAKMREADIYTLLVKGQGIAQCYERPLWRTSQRLIMLSAMLLLKKAGYSGMVNDWGYTEVVKLRAIGEGRPLRHVGNAHRKV